MRMRPVEIACDESGFSGTNLLDPTTPVITHAAVDLGVADAVELLATVRANSRRTTAEYKSTQLLKRRVAINSLLESLQGRATVHLTDKRYFVVTRIVDFLLGEPSYAAGTSLAFDLRATALTLHRDGPAIFGDANWYAVLTSFVAMMRTKRLRVINRPAVDEFFEALGQGEHQVVGRLRERRPRVEEVLTVLLDERSSVPPPLEPMLSALVDTTLLWTNGVRTVDIVHDEQSALTPHRIDCIRTLLAEASAKRGMNEGGAASGASVGVDGDRYGERQGRLHLELRPLRGFRMVDSREDPRVQVADLLAGVARHLATQELHGRGDPALTALLRPYVARSSLWADAPSWRRLCGEPKCDEVLTNR